MQEVEREGPMKGIRVVELGLWIAGPAAAAILADWGAEVIKVEPPEGDPARSALASILGIDGERSPPFDVDNRGKRSVVLNLREQSEKSKLFMLLENADVFVTNMRPAALARLGLEPEKLQEKFPKLVIAQVTGYGSHGPQTDRAGYDNGAFWAYSGLANQFSGETGYPPILPPAFGDHMTGISLASGIAAALYKRTNTGVGSIVETSLLKTGIYGAACDFAMRMRFDSERVPLRRKDSESPLVNNYKTKDGRILWILCVESSRHWPVLLTAMKLRHLNDDERFKTTRLRFENRAALIAEFDKRFAEQSLEEWAIALDEHQVWWAPVQRLEEVLEDAQANVLESFQDIPGEEAEIPIRTVATPVDFNRKPTRPSGPTPQLGADTEEILGALKQNT